MNPSRIHQTGEVDRAAAAMVAARIRLLLDYPWWGTLALKLLLEPDYTFATFAVNGTVLKYNPAFVLTLTQAELMGCIAHEVMHCALLHPWRRGSRDKQEWNEACDYAINGILIKAGFTLPKDVLHDPQYDNQSAEAIFASRAGKKAKEQAQQPQPGTGTGQPQPGQPQPLSTGTVEDAPPPPQPGTGQPGQQPQPGSGQPQPAPGTGQPQPGPAPQTELDWVLAGKAVEGIGRKAGKLPGEAARSVDHATAPRENWKEIMREFVQETIPSDYTWTTPNRRHIHAGLYLPGVTKEGCPPIDWVTDSSGSVRGPELSIGWAQFVDMAREVRPEVIRYWSCDTKPHLLGTWTPDELPDAPPKHRGGGGTLFGPGLNAALDSDPAPACILYYSPDMECADSPKDPGVPVLWISPIQCRRAAPDCGRSIRIDAYAD